MKNRLSKNYKERSNRFDIMRKGGLQKFFIIIVLLLVAENGLRAQSSIKLFNSVVDLKTDYRTTPIGIDHFPTHLSWRMDASAREGAMQTAYRIQSGSSKEDLLAGKYIWDSGTILSGASTQIPYAGPSLKNGERFFWRVKIWDEKNHESEWTEPSWFESGLLDEAAWLGAKWIGSQQDMNTPDLAPKDVMGPWISATNDIIEQNFSKDFNLPDKPIERAMLYVGLSKDSKKAIISINNNLQEMGRFKGKAEGELDIAFLLKPGENNRIEIIFDKTNQKKVLSVGIRIVFADATEMIIKSGMDWNSKNTGSNSVNKVEIIDSYGGTKYGEAQIFSRKSLPPTWFRKKVAVRSGLVRARLYLCALGQGLAYFNGEPVNDVYYPSPQSDYEEFGYYTSHDVTNLLRSGDNTLAVLLDGGWYDQVGGFGAIFSYGRPGLKAIVKLEYADKTSDQVISDVDWQWKESAISSANVYRGEKIDFRNDQTEWKSFDVGKDWKSAQIIPSCTPKTIAMDVNPVQADSDESYPIKTWKTGSQSWLFDFGVVKHGVVRLKFHEAATKTIYIRYSEYAENGQIWNVPLSHWWCHRSIQSDEIISDGRPHTWQSHLTTKSFRYVEVCGLTESLQPLDIKAIPVHTKADVLATFESSDLMLNKLFENGIRTCQNYVNHVSGDIPRERCLWGAEAIYSKIPATYCFDWAPNHRLENTLWWTGIKTKDGIPGQVGVGKRLTNMTESFIWSSTPVFITSEMKNFYDDVEPLKTYYSDVRHFVQYFEETSKNGTITIPNKLSDHAAQQGVDRNPADNDLINSMAFFDVENQFAKMAEDLGETSDADHAREFSGKIQTSIMKKYDYTNHTFGNGTHNSLALAYGLIPDTAEQKALARSLAGYYQTNGHRFDGGFMSYEIYPMLSKYGYVDDAYEILINADYPSPAGSIKMYDATTFWEAYNPDKKAQMARGLNFFAFAHSIGWMITDLAGIRYSPELPNGKKMILEPKIPTSGKLTYAKASVKTPMGLVKSSWEMEGKKINWSFSIYMYENIG